MISNWEPQNRVAYDFLRPVDPNAEHWNDNLFPELVKTRAFQRLKEIRFLGGIDYLLVKSPNGSKGNIRHTRYQHSLGVARLALTYCRARPISNSNRRLVVAAALLHDIGHAPLSHSLEPLFKRVFGVDHHSATKDIIRGRVPLGIEVFEVLQRNRIDVDHLIEIIVGEVDRFDGFFGGPINFDTVEGILRSQTYAAPDVKLPSPEAVIESAVQRLTERDRILVDSFWEFKDQVYRSVINSETGILADYICQLIGQQNIAKLSVQDFFLTEDQMFRKLQGLRELLKNPNFTSLAWGIIKRPIYYKQRRFFIQNDSDFNSRDDNRRYQQTKIDKVLNPRRFDDPSFSEKSSTGELFYNDGDRES